MCIFLIRFVLWWNCFWSRAFQGIGSKGVWPYVSGGYGIQM
jgi:hypothetical protein